MGRILVTGGTGGLGRALLRRLKADAQERVTVLVRRPGSLEGHEAVVADLTAAPWKTLVTGCTTVYHLAAFVHRAAITRDDVAQMAAVNHTATAALAEACSRAGAKLVLASSVAVLGAGGTRTGDDAEPAPVTGYGRTKLLGERAVRGDPDLQYAILRFPLLYGPHGRGNMERMLRAIACRRYWPIGSPQTVRKSCLHFEDAAEALILASRHLVKDTRIVAPAEPATLEELQRAAYSAVGLHCPRLSVPYRVATAAAACVDSARRMFGNTSTIRQSITTLVNGAWYDGTPFRRITGFQQRIGEVEGLRTTADWMRSEGVIG